MKGISVLMKMIGTVMIIGTAGSADHVMIGFSEVLTGVIDGILFIALGQVLPYVWRAFRYVMLAILR